MNIKTASKIFGVSQKTIYSLLGVEIAGLRVEKNGHVLPNIILTKDQKIFLAQELYNRTWEAKYLKLKLKFRIKKCVTK